MVCGPWKLPWRLAAGTLSVTLTLARLTAAGFLEAAALDAVAVVVADAEVDAVVPAAGVVELLVDALPQPASNRASTAIGALSAARGAT